MCICRCIWMYKDTILDPLAPSEQMKRHDSTGVCDKNNHARRLRNMPPAPPDINVVRCCFFIIGFVLRKKQLFQQVLSVRPSTLKLGGAGGKKNILNHRVKNDCFHHKHRSGCTFLFVVLIHVYVIPTPCQVSCKTYPRLPKKGDVLHARPISFTVNVQSTYSLRYILR